MALGMSYVAIDLESQFFPSLWGKKTMRGSKKHMEKLVIYHVAVIYHVDPSSDLRVDLSWALLQELPLVYGHFLNPKLRTFPLGHLRPVMDCGCRETRTGLFTSTGATYNSEGPSQLCCNCIVLAFSSCPILLASIYMVLKITSP